MLLKRSRIGFVLLAVAGLVGVLPAIAFAQLPQPRLDWVYPVGTSQGSTVEVSLGGGDLDELNALQFSHPGIIAKQKMNPASEFTPATPVANVFIVEVGADVPDGIYEVRSVGRFGVSNPRRFSVDRLTPLVEAGNNNSLESAQTVELNSIVDGRAAANVRDYFKLNLTQGQRIFVEAMTDSVGSRMIATLEILDLDGRELAKARGTNGFRSTLDFTAPADGVYVVSAYDFLFRGSAEYFYRLKLHNGPYIDWLEPAVAAPGEGVALTVVGRNLGDQAKPSGDTIDGQPLERLTLPPQAIAASGLTFGNWLIPVSGHPLKTVPITVTRGEQQSSPVPLVVSELPIAIEKEAASATGEASVSSIQVPCIVSGRFNSPRDMDVFEFDAKGGQVFWIELFSHRLGMPVDGFLVCQQVIQKEDGSVEYKKLHDVDDPGDRNTIGADFDLTTDDPSFRFQVPGDGRYRLVLTDQFGGTRNDPRVGYLLRIRPESPRLELIVDPPLGRPGNGNQAVVGTIAVRQGGTEKVEVRVNRIDGLAGEVTVRLEGLPEQVTCAPSVVPANSGRTTLVMNAAADAPAWQGPVRVIGTYLVNGEQREQQAKIGTLVWGTGDRNQISAVSRMTTELVASVVDAEAEPVTVHATSSDPIVTSRGANLEVPVSLQRRLGFNAAFNINAVGLPGEIKPAGPVQFAENNGEGKLVLNLANNNVKPGRYRVLLQGDLKYKQARNPQAITKAQERQKQVEAWTAEWQGKKEAATKLMADLPARREQLQQALVQSEAKTTEADTKLSQQAAAVAQAGEALQQARAKLAAQADNQELKSAADQAKTAFDATTEQLQTALAERDGSIATLVKAQADMTALAQSETDAKEVLASADQKIGQLAELKKQADAQFDAINKANQPVDRTYTVVSLPIDIMVESSPMAIQAAAVETQAGSEAALSVQLERKYGFADAVQIAVTPPENVAGLTVEGGAIAADQTQVATKIVTTAETPPGEYPITIKATAKFNNVDVQTTTTVTLKVIPRA